MNRFRSRRGRGGVRPDDPTEMLQVWRDQQRAERLAETQELPVFLDDEPAVPVPRARRRRTPYLVAAALATLGVAGGVAVATTAARPDAERATSSTAPATGSPSAVATPSDPSTSPGSPTPSATATTPPTAPGAGRAGPPGPGDGSGPAAPDGPPAPPDRGPGAGGGPAGPPAGPGAG